MDNICDEIQVPLCIKKGSHYIIPVYYKTCDKVAIDLTGYSAQCQVRRTPDADDDADITLTVANGGITIDETLGIVYLIFTSASTLALDSDYVGTWICF